MSLLTKIFSTTVLTLLLLPTSVAGDGIHFLDEGSVNITLSSEGSHHFGLAVFAGGGNGLRVYATENGNDFDCWQQGELALANVMALISATGQSTYTVTPDCNISKRERIQPAGAEKVAIADWEYLSHTDYVGFVQNANSVMDVSVTNHQLSVFKSGESATVFTCTLVAGSYADLMLSMPSQQAFYQFGKDTEGHCEGSIEIDKTLLVPVKAK